MPCLHTEEAKIEPQVQERDLSRVLERESRLSSVSPRNQQSIEVQDS